MINWPLLKSPSNWLLVWSVAIIAALLLHFVTHDLIQSMSPPTSQSPDKQAG